MWMLTICIGVSWAGCGSAPRFQFADEQSCYRALDHIRTGDSPIAESDNKRNTVAYCAPITPGDEKKLFPADGAQP